MQHGARELARSGAIGAAGRAEPLEHRPLKRDSQRADAGDAAGAIRRLDRRGDERIAVEQCALHVALPVAPYVAE
jgi:hypothetical protein